MKRTEIKEQYKWDLSKIYPSFEAFKLDLKKGEEILKELTNFKGKITESKQSLLAFINLSEQFDMILSDLYVFGKQSLDVEPKNEEAQNAYANAQTLYVASMEALSFIKTEIVENGEKIKKIITGDPDFADLQFYFAESLHFTPHTLSLEHEQIISETHSFGSKLQNTFETIRPSFKPVVVDGKEEFLNMATLNKFLKNKNREIRKQAYQNFYAEYQKLANTYATILDGHIKYVSFVARQQKFNSALEASLFNDNAPKELFEKILNMANVKYRHHLHQYFDLKKELIGLEECFNYDLSVPPVEDLDLKFTVEEGLEMIYQALAPLGEDYVQTLKKGIESRWVDFYTHEEKRAGAYSWGTYRSQPYILMNWVGDLDSVYTLAHEIGHSMHTFFSSSNNRYLNSSYKIFVAEVASTVNEVFLTNYLLKKYQNDPKVTTYLYYNLLSDIVGTIYRQPFFAEFERTLYQKSEAGEPISNAVIAKIYRDMSKDYYGNNIALAKEVDVSCYSVPHFYYRFYVYKYTIGMSCALTIVSRILETDPTQKDKYLNFLKSGGTKWPIDLLKDANVDPLSDQVYDEAFTYFAKSLKEFKDLLKK